MSYDFSIASRLMPSCSEGVIARKNIASAIHKNSILFCWRSFSPDAEFKLTKSKAHGSSHLKIDPFGYSFEKLFRQAFAILGCDWTIHDLLRKTCRMEIPWL